MDHTDLRIPLPQCGVTTLRLGELEFELDAGKPVGRGGTCLVYHALQKDDRGLGRKVILKEFYPDLSGCDKWRDRQSGSLTIPTKESIKDRRKRFFDSYEQLKALFNEEELNQYTVQAHRLPQGNGTDYMVVDYSSGLTLRDYLDRDHSLYDFFSRMKMLAQGLEKLHRRGLVHMDLKPENLLCYEEHDLVKFLDTDSFVEKAIFAGEAVEITLSGSQGYTAPEVWELAEGLAEDWVGCYFQRQDFAELGHRADIFSFGVILCRYLWKDQPPEAPLSDCLRQREQYLSGKALRMVEELLEKTLAHQPEDRFETMAQLAGKIEALLPLLDPKEPLLAEQFSENPVPVLGREEALALLEEFFRSQTDRWGRVICISGIGGIGKSALARLFAQRHAGEYDVITEVSAASAEEAVERIRILHWDPEKGLSEESRRDSYKKMLIQLCKGQKVLLLVHDYDGTSDANFGIWEELGCDVILTSRSDWSARVPMVRLTCVDLGDEGAKAVFWQYYLQKCETEERRSRLSALLEREAVALKQLLRQMDYHPMTLQLLAQYMTYVPGEELGPAEALKVLTSGVFDAASPREFQSGQDSVDNSNVYGHLSKLFRWSMDSKRFRAEEVETLRNMMLIPPGLGICAARFRALTGLSSDWLERLKRSGWLEYLPRQQDVLAEDAPAGVYILPNVLQQVLIKEPELVIRMDQADTYGDMLYQRFQQEGNYPQRQAIMAHMEQLVTLPEDPTENCLWMLLQLAQIYCILSRLEKLTELTGRFLRLYEQVPPVVREDSDIRRALRQMRRMNVLLEGTWDSPEELAVMYQQGPESMSEVFQEIHRQFEYGDARQAFAMVKKVNAQDWSRMDLSERVVFLSILIQMQSKMGWRIAAEKNYEVLSNLYWADVYRSQEVILDPHFFGAACEYAALRLQSGCTGEMLHWISQLRDAARAKLGRENIFTGRLEELLARGYEYRRDFGAAAACRERTAEAENVELEAAENYLHLSLDYQKLQNPEKMRLFREKALSIYNSSLQESADGPLIEQPEELAAFYFDQAVATVSHSMVPLAMVLLENWLRLARRLFDSETQVAAWFAAVGSIYERYGLKEKADFCRGFAQGWAPRLAALNRLRPNSRWLKNWIEANIGEYYDQLLELAKQHRFR